MEMRSSANYSWNLKDVLGQGATGAVFKGRHKKTGEVYAVKVFSNLGMTRPPDVRRREFDVLKKLHHENIVKLFDSETELRSQSEVILMELCSGGSLFTMLESPENAYGFSENDFKQVVRDVVAGMQHLREQGIVHRDLKPGNIMRLLKEDGSFVYKLTDFGAARELEPSEEFLSVYGTEEYLHPDLYERGVLRKHGNKAFNAVVDLWSIGVTFYHIATGQLPFRPYGGRQNKDTMYTITSKKAPGMISGFQKSEGEEIEWSDKLPEHTRLSQGLRDLLTPVLAGILESDPAKAMSFEEFFFKAQDILTRKVIDVYSVHSSSFHKIYIKPQETFAKFQELIAVQTGVSAAQQKLFFKYEEFRPDLMAPASTYPGTSDYLPMLMTGGEYITPERLSLQKIPKAPKLPEKSTLEGDASVAKIMASRAYFCKHAVQLYHQQTRAMRETIESLLKNLKRESFSYASFCKEVELQWYTLKQSSSICYASQSHLMSVYESLLANLTEPQHELESIQEDIHTVKSWTDAKRQSESELNKTDDGIAAFRKLLSDIVENNRFHIFMVTFQQDIESQNFHKVVATYTTNIEEIYQSFRRDKHHKRLSYADEGRHQFDRKNLVQLCEKLTRVTEEAVGKRSELHGQLENLLNEVSRFYREVERHHSSLARQLQASDAHLLAIQRFQEQCKEKSQAIVQRLQRLMASPSSVTMATADKSVAVTVNGLEENEKDSGVLQRIENELVSLSFVTKESSRTARSNSEQLKTLVENFIMLYSSINEHMMKDLESLQQTVIDESPPSN